MTAMMQLSDDELLVLARECQGEAARGDGRDAGRHARDIQTEVRRRFSNAQTVSAALGTDLAAAATQSRWRELLGHAASTCRRIGGR